MTEGALVLELRFPARAAQLRQVRREVRRVLEGCRCGDGEIRCAVLAVSEACMNIMQHAYGGEGQGEIVLQIFDSAEVLTFRLMDFAPPVDPRSIQSRCLEDLRPGGLGVHFMHEVMDECVFLECPEGAGNLFQMKKRKGT